VLEEGRVVELGTHDELLARGGRYHTMFTLQAQRFAAGEPEPEDEEVDLDALA
jgi:ATP-binding cassette subfamily B protein